jgi:hypothetical protein
MVDYRPGIHLVPLTLHYFNLHSVLPRSRWQKLRKAMLAKYGLRCQTCGKTKTESRRINCHEVWDYRTHGEPAPAVLTGLSLACWHCHAIEHFGNTEWMVEQGYLTSQAIEDTVQHFCRVNRVDRAEFERHRDAAYAEWERLSAMRWEVSWGAFTEVVGEYYRDEYAAAPVATQIAWDAYVETDHPLADFLRV